MTMPNAIKELAPACTALITCYEGKYHSNEWGYRGDFQADPGGNLIARIGEAIDAGYRSILINRIGGHKRTWHDGEWHWGRVPGNLWFGLPLRVQWAIRNELGAYLCDIRDRYNCRVTVFTGSRVHEIGAQQGTHGDPELNGGMPYDRLPSFFRGGDDCLSTQLPWAHAAMREWLLHASVESFAFDYSAAAPNINDFVRFVRRHPEKHFIGETIPKDPRYHRLAPWFAGDSLMWNPDSYRQYMRDGVPEGGEWYAEIRSRPKDRQFDRARAAFRAGYRLIAGVDLLNKVCESEGIERDALIPPSDGDFQPIDLAA